MPQPVDDAPTSELSGIQTDGAQKRSNPALAALARAVIAPSASGEWLTPSQATAAPAASSEGTAEAVHRAQRRTTIESLPADAECSTRTPTPTPRWSSTTASWRTSSRWRHRRSRSASAR